GFCDQYTYCFFIWHEISHRCLRLFAPIVPLAACGEEREVMSEKKWKGERRTRAKADHRVHGAHREHRARAITTETQRSQRRTGEGDLWQTFVAKAMSERMMAKDKCSQYVATGGVIIEGV